MNNPPWGLQIDCDTARLLIRPHDLELHSNGHGGPGIQARVTRVQSAGPIGKIELTSDHQPIYVEMSHDRFRQEPRAVGVEVFVPRATRDCLSKTTRFDVLA